MDYKHNIDFHTIIYLFIVILGAITVGLYFQSSSWFLEATGIIILSCGCILLLHKEHNNIKTLNNIVEALHNNDYSFRLPRKGSVFNRFLNEIVEIMQKEKVSTVQQDKYYELIINSMSIGVIVSDENGNVVKCNDEVLTLFNRKVLTHLSQLAAWENLHITLAELSPKEKRHILIKNVSKELNISVHLDNISIKGRLLHIYTFNDIHTEIDRNEFDSWIKLTRVLTHEIMNGIAPISSLSDTMKQETELPLHIKDGLEAISTSSHSLINFVESYRRFTRIPTPIPTLVNVSTLIKQVKELFNNVNIGTHIEPDDLIIYADESLILQVITNIVKNAIEAFKEEQEKEIRIKVYCTESEAVKIEISNNGPAIPKEEIEEIFVPFFTTKQNGNGIGLSISRQIMILSGGNLSFSSTPNNKFTTTFTLTFN